MNRPDMASMNTPWSAALNDPELWQLMARIGTLRTIKAGTRLINAGEVSRHSYIVCKGLLRHFYHSPEGRERNKNFFREGQVSGSINSQLTGGPCPYNLDAVEDSEIIEFANFAINDSDKQPDCLNQLFDTTLKELFLRNEGREALLLTKSGEERYRWVLKHQHWLTERLPQYHLASYLGMDAVSLSRIKARLKP